MGDIELNTFIFHKLSRGRNVGVVLGAIQRRRAHATKRLTGCLNLTWKSSASTSPKHRAWYGCVMKKAANT
jgi:hypothetical protein